MYVHRFMASNACIIAGAGCGIAVGVLSGLVFCRCVDAVLDGAVRTADMRKALLVANGVTLRLRQPA